MTTVDLTHYFPGHSCSKCKEITLDIYLSNVLLVCKIALEAFFAISIFYKYHYRFYPLFIRRRAPPAQRMERNDFVNGFSKIRFIPS